MRGGRRTMIPGDERRLIIKQNNLLLRCWLSDRDNLSDRSVEAERKLIKEIGVLVLEGDHE